MTAFTSAICYSNCKLDFEKVPFKINLKCDKIQKKHLRPLREIVVVFTGWLFIIAFSSSIFCSNCKLDSCFFKQTNQKTTWPRCQYIFAYALLGILLALLTPHRGVLTTQWQMWQVWHQGPAQARKEARAQHRRAKKRVPSARPAILHSCAQESNSDF